MAPPASPASPASPRIRAFTRALLASTALVGVGLGLVPLRPVPVRAEPLPTGGQVVSGGVTIGAPSGNALAITQSSQNAIVNWQGFSVGPGHRVDIRQPSAGAAILNRVTGATPSTIAGQLNANGQVYLVNPNGVTITKSGQVNAAGFVASSLGITDADFKAGRRQFRGSGASAKVANHGTITIGRGGYAALIGGQVGNTGTIAVPMGRVGLGSGERATLDLSGDGFLQVAVPTGAAGRRALIEHSGRISADGGSVVLTAAAARDMARQAVNLSGVVEARSVAGRNGRITLSGGEGAVALAPNARLDASGLDGAGGGRVRIAGGLLDVAGRVDVSGAKGGRARLKASENLTLTGQVRAEGRAGRGGRVTATAPVIATHAALIEASGASGGGVVRAGGGRLGQGPLARAERVNVDAATTIRADATVRGDGGDVVVWSDVATRFAGRIEARGGAQGGNGGQAEVSSRGVLSYDGTTLLTAARGAFGTLLLDPYNVRISDGTQTTGGGFSAGADDSVINVTTLRAALASANVTVSTGAAGSAGAQAGDITVAAPLTWSSGSRLTLEAARAVAINVPVTIAGGGQLTLTTATETVGTTTEPLLSFGNGASVTFAANASQSGQALTINGTGYTLIRTLAQLDAVDGRSGVDGSAMTPHGPGLSGAYALANDIDAAGTTFTTGVIAGGSTSLTEPTPFSGRLDGLGHAVRNLTIDGGNKYVGLIGYTTGTVRDIGVIGGSVRGLEAVGGLVGRNAGTISQSHAAGAVSGSSGSGIGGLGGLVGRNDQEITQSYATGAVDGSQAVGGLVGRNVSGSTVSQSYATGTVSGSLYVGGLAGGNAGTIRQSYATGAVTGDIRLSEAVGGLVGFNFGTINQSYAAGAVSSAASRPFQMGGLVGRAEGTVTASVWDTQTSGQPTSGAGTGYTTRQLQGLDPLPDGSIFSAAKQLGDGTTSAFSGGANGLYPYLTHFFPAGVQAISGTAYTDRGLTPLASSGTSPAYVTLAIAGTQRQVTTGANGAYYLALPAGTLASTGTATLAYTTGDGTPAGPVTGASLIDAAGTTRDLDVWGNTLIAPTAAAALSAAPATVAALLTPANRSLLAAAQGGTGLGDPAGLTGVGYVATAAAGFTLDAGLGSGAAGGLYLRSTPGPVRVARAQTLSGAGLTLLSAGSLVFEAGVTARGAAAVTLGYDAANPANLSFAAGRSLTFANADGSTAIAPVSGQALTINGQGYTLIRTMADLDGIDGVAAVAGGAINPQADGLSGRYALAADLPESSTIYTNALVGTNSSGDSRTQFSGTFEGLGHTVTGLTIAKSGDYAGLFGFVASGGTVRDLGLVGGGVRGRNYVGGLVGYNDGTISQAYATGSVSGDISVGGLVGENAGGGRISQAYATGSVSGDSVGGLVGSNYGGSISQAYATGRVSGTGSLGGLVGNNQFGTITASAWDSQTSGTATGLGVDSNSQAGNVAGLTTRQLQGLDPLPGGGTFSTLTALGDGTTSAFSGGAGGLYPYLTSFFPTGVQAITGTAQTAAGTALAGAQVGFYADGRLLGGGTVSSGANGYVYHAVAAGTLGAGTVRIGASLTPAGGIDATGLFYTDSAALTGRTLALGPIIAGQNRQSTAQVTFSGLRADLAATFGADRFAALSTALAATPLDLTATGRSFTLDQALDASGSVRLATTDADATLTLAADLNLGTGSLTLAAAGAIDQSAGAITAGRLTGSSGGDARLAGSGNALGTLAGFAADGSLTLAAGPSLTLASGTQVTAAGDVVLSTTGAFVNDAGRGAVASRAGRWLIYAANSAGNSFGGLDSGHTAVWGTAAGATVAVPGNRYVFAERPTLTVTATDLTKTYGEDATGRVTGAYTLTGLRPGVVGAYLGDTAETALSGTPRVTSPGAGVGAAVADSPYAITADLTGLTSPAGYALALGDAGRLTVTPAPVIVTARSGSSAYGDTPADPGLSATGLVGGQDASVLTGLSNSFDLDAASAAGRYALAVAGTLANRNYVVADRRSGTWTVTPRALVVTPDALTRAYGEAAPARGGASGDGLVNGDRLGDVGLLTPATAASGVGRYALTGADATFAAGAAGNYAITYATRGDGLTIVPRALTVSAQAQSRVYGDADPVLTYTVGGRGLVDGDGLSGRLATTATAGSGVGTYAITQGSLAASANYALTYQGADLAVTPRVVTLSGTRVYDGGTGLVGGLLTAGNRVDGDAVTVAGLGTLAAKDVGSRALADLSGLTLSNPNYTLAGATGTVAITPATLTYTADAARRTYGSANPALTGRVAGFLGADTPANSTTGTLAFTTQAGAASNVGRYAVTGSGLSAGNYVLVQAAGNATALTVAPAPLAVTGTKSYDATTGFHAGQLAVTGGVSGETVTLTAGAGTATSADAAIYAGSSLTGLRLAVAGGNGLASNYALPATGTLTITPALVTVAAVGGRSVYGDTPIDPGLSATGLVGGQDASVLTGLSSSFDLDATSAAGAYRLTVRGRLTNGNYRLSAAEAGRYTIDRRPLTVTADGLTRVYGDADPVLTYSLGGRGLANGDRLTGGLVTAAGPGSAVGRYAIGQGSLAASADYALRYVGADLAVTARPITVVAEPQARLVGAANPVLSYSLGGRGLANGDRLTGTLATAAGADSEPGLYRITRGSLSASANYSLGFVGADLAVLARPTQPLPGPQPNPQPDPRPITLDPSELASTVERAARLDARPVAPERPLLLGLGPDGALRVSDPRFDATLVCTSHQGGCFLTPLLPAPAPQPQAGLSAR